MRILVTGASGFLGTTLVKKLKELGDYEVFSGRVNILDRTIVDNTFAVFEPEVVFHLAANSSGRASMDETFSTNVIGTYNIVRAMPKDCKIIFASSSLVYGDSMEFAKQGELDCPFPDTAYGASKLAAEAYVHHADGTSCRITGIIGPNMRKGVVLHLINEAKRPISSPMLHRHEDYISTFNSKPGSCLQYIHVEDVVDRMIEHMDSRASGPVNLATTNPLTIERVIEIIQEELGTNKDIDWQGKENSRYYNINTFGHKPLKYPTTYLALRATLENYK